MIRFQGIATRQKRFSWTFSPWVFSIPKRLRIYFMLDRSLLAGLSRCAWKVVRLYLKQAVPYEDAMPGAVISVQSFGDFQNFHPHLHILATDGSFYK